MSTSTRALLQVTSLKKHYSVFRFAGLGGKVGDVKAVDGVTFTVRAGEIFGLVGESGSGKTTVGKLILNLETPTEGTVSIDGVDVRRARGSDKKRAVRSVQAVFQDPYSSLSPRMRIRDIVSEPLRMTRILPKREIAPRVTEVLQQVGLPEDAGNRFPHEFSGGQRQRVAVARAIASQPRLIVLDEPVSALDVSIRAQILNLLRALQNDLGLSYLLIAHDLAVVERMADTIGVMYLGRIVEQALASEIFEQPLHPYTQALLVAVPVPDPARRRRDFKAASGEIASALHPPSGCHFHPRCPFATEICETDVPAMRELAPEHLVACHHAEQFLTNGPVDVSTDTANP